METVVLKVMKMDTISNEFDEPNDSVFDGEMSNVFNKHTKCGARQVIK